MRLPSKTPSVSFREAWMRDPTCAICYWGEAWAWGPFLNGGMPPNQAAHAYTAIQKALALAEDHASPSEKAFIEAMAVRYVENFEPDKRKEQDTAYVEAMRLVAERYPDDLEAATFYADALFLLETADVGYRDLNDPNVVRLHRVLEGVLARDIRHLGHAISTFTPPNRQPDQTRPKPVPSIWAAPFREPATSTTCPPIPGTRWAAGVTPYVPTLRPGIRIKRPPSARGLPSTHSTISTCSSSRPSMDGTRGHRHPGW